MRSASPEAEAPRWATRIAAAVISVVLALLVAGSSARAGLVLGLERVPLVALIAALLTALLALSRWRLRWAVPASLLPALPVGLWIAGGRLSWSPRVDLHLLGHLVGLLAQGTAWNTTFPDFLFYLGIWAAAAWLGWWAIRFRRPLVALVPPVGIVATNVLNVPQDQLAYVLGTVLCSCALLLVTAQDRLATEARRRGLWLHDDVRWSYWEMGVVVTLAVLAVAAFVPPVSTLNRTLGWEGQLSRGASGQPTGVSAQSGATRIGYSPSVRLSGPLKLGSQIAFTYTTDLSLPEPYYFVGDTAADPFHGAWVPALGGDQRGILPRNTRLPWTEVDQQQQTGRFVITVQTPPATAPRTLFYPGQLQQLSVTSQLLVQYGVPRQSVVAVDQTEDATGVPRRYTATVAASTATAAQLEQAGTAYQGWVQDDALPLDGSYERPAVLQLINQLAQQAVAGVPADPYDQATAIQKYLRTHYHYTLHPKRVPRGEDALQAFLNHQTGGYCTYFATAMADMLRSLGIPVSLANGFGPGTYDPKTGRFVVRASDAHTWPVVYFPGYGWIPFEPTPQPGYGTIPRGGATPACATAGCALAPVAGALGGPSQVAGHGQTDLTQGGGGPATQRGGPPLWALMGAAVLLLLLVAVAVLALRWLRPSTLGATWRRTGRLARLAGVPVRRSESPLEFGRRLGEAVPGAAGAARALAGLVSAAAYGPPGTAPPSDGAMREAWALLRAHLLRAAVRRGLHRRRALPSAGA